MTEENKYPAIAAETVPLSDAEAMGRITEYMIEHPETGLIGCRFLSLNQFVAGLRGCNWLVETEPLMTQGSIETVAFRIRNKSRLVVGIIHSFGNGFQVINCKAVTAEEWIAPKPEAKQNIFRPPWG